jgi:toxin ParE1/3/4
VRLYFIADDANRDLEDIMDYFFSVNIDAGDQFVNSFNQKCLYLTQFPYIGKLYSDLAPDLRGVRLERYIIFYRGFPDSLIIVRVVNASRNLKAIFSGG